MAKNPDWHQLSENLVRLQIVFPRAHSEGGYSPTPETLMNLIKNMKNIKDLTLKGISGDPVPLDQFLNQLPSLNKLVLGNCFLCFSHHMEFKHESLQTLHILEDEFHLDQLYGLIPQKLVKMFPNLEELVLRPSLPLTFSGFLLEQVWFLCSLQYLKRLEITISSLDCANNMPELIYVLRDFPALRYLTISWGQFVDLNNYRMARLISWLHTALEADNANIHVQTCYSMHSSLYSNPPTTLT